MIGVSLTCAAPVRWQIQANQYRFSSLEDNAPDVFLVEETLRSQGIPASKSCSTSEASSNWTAFRC